MDRVIPDKTSRSTRARWSRGPSRSTAPGWANFKKHGEGQVRLRTPFCDLTEEEREHGRTISSAASSTHLETKKYKLHVRVFLSRYRGYALCPECKGARLRKEALYVRVGGKNLAEVVRMNIAEAHAFFGRPGTRARKRPPSPTRSWWKSASG